MGQYSALSYKQSWPVLSWQVWANAIGVSPEVIAKHCGDKAETGTLTTMPLY